MNEIVKVDKEECDITLHPDTNQGEINYQLGVLSAYLNETTLRYERNAQEYSKAEAKYQADKMYLDGMEQIFIAEFKPETGKRPSVEGMKCLARAQHQAEFLALVKTQEKRDILKIAVSTLERLIKATEVKISVRQSFTKSLMAEMSGARYSNV